jgi:hypothetical protein
MFLEDSAQIPSQRNRIPYIRPDVHLSKHHPSGRRELTVWTFLYVKKLRTALACIRPDVSAARPDAIQCSIKLWDFFPKHRYGKIAATVQTMWILVRTRSSIRQVAHSKFRRPDDGLHGPVVWTRELHIWKLRASDQPSERHILWSGRAKSWYGNCVQEMCDRPDDWATPSGHGSNRKRISCEFWKADRTVVRSDASCLLSELRLGISSQTLI